MSGFKIKVKDVKEFVRNEQITYARGHGKTLSVRLRAGPNVERYVVTVGDEAEGFTVLGDAVRWFNDN
jgi:hypothetical protein